MLLSSFSFFRAICRICVSPDLSQAEAIIVLPQGGRVMDNPNPAPVTRCVQATGITHGNVTLPNSFVGSLLN